MIQQKFAAAFTILALSFGLATLWLPDAWPFVILQLFLCLALLAQLFPLESLNLRISFHPLLLLPAFVSALAAFQFSTGNTANLWESRRSAIEWSTFTVAAFLAYNLCRDGKTRSKAVEYFALGSAAFCLLSVLQNYSAPGRVWWLFDSGFEGQVFGPFTYHTKFANFAQLGLAAAVWTAAKRPDRLWLHLAAAAVLIASVVASASRGGVFVISLEALVLLICYLRSTQARDAGSGNYGRSRLRLAVFALPALGLAIALLGPESFLSRLASTDFSLDARWAINQAGIDMAKIYFWSGSGLGTWSTVYPEFARFDLGLRVNQAHNDWLQWLIEGGFPLLLLTFCIWFCAIRAARLEWWSLGFVFVWFHGLFDYPMQQTPAFAALQFAFWGAALATLRPLAKRETM